MTDEQPANHVCVMCKHRSNFSDAVISFIRYVGVLPCWVASLPR